MNEPKVSVIIPYFRSPDTLEACLHSILAQTHTHLEIVCVGEGVDDPAHAVAKHYATTYPEKVMAVQQQVDGAGNQKGGAAGRNLGLALCTGEYIMFADHDDTVEPNIVASLLEALTAHKADLVCCGFDRICGAAGHRISRENATGHVRCEELTDVTVSRMAFLYPAPWGKLYPRLLLENRHFSERLPMAGEDLAFFLPLGKDIRRLAVVPDILYHHVVHGKNTTLHFGRKSFNVFLENLQDVQANFVQQSYDAQRYLTLAAFIHVGIALVHRVTQNGSMTYHDSISQSRSFLDAHFPAWRKIGPLPDGRITLRGFAVYIVKLLYLYGGVGLFMRCYNAIIRFTGRDLKW